MSRLLTSTEAERHFVLMLFEAYAIAGLLLAATGIYGVLSGSVTERTREIGVRAALGASRASLLSLVLRQGMALAVAGVAFGLAGAAVASRGMAALLFGISVFDPVTYCGVAAILLCIAAAACLLPARRAATIDPMQALRSE
jgi:putative ABC transport system permease protein